MVCSTQAGKFSSNTGKLHFEGLIHLLRYIRDKKNFGIKYHSKIEDAPISDLLIQAIIETKNQLMVLSDNICKDFPDTGRSTGVYIVFYQGVPIDDCTHVPGAVSNIISNSKYNAKYNTGMDLANFKMPNDKFLNKDPYVFPEQATLIILDSKPAICMANNGKYTYNTKRIQEKCR